MPPKRRGVSGDRVYSSTPPLRQKRFPPRRRQARSSASSLASRKLDKKQQTLTQIHFTTIFSDSEDDVTVEAGEEKDAVSQSESEKENSDIEHDEDWTEAGPKRKRRRTDPGAHSSKARRTMRTSKLKNKEQGQQTMTQMPYLLWPELDGTRDAFGQDEPRPSDFATSRNVKRSRRDPAISDQHHAQITRGDEEVDADERSRRGSSNAHLQTPKYRRTLEVPSSQSPAVTPVSNRSLNGTLFSERPALVERSSNILFSARRDAGRTSPSKTTVLNLEKPIGPRLQCKEPGDTTMDIRNPSLQDCDLEYNAETFIPARSAHPDAVLSSPVPLLEEFENAHYSGSVDDLHTPKDGLPQPRWSQLEYRDVTQYARGQQSHLDHLSARVLYQSSPIQNFEAPRSGRTDYGPGGVASTMRPPPDTLQSSPVMPSAIRASSPPAELWATSQTGSSPDNILNETRKGDGTQSLRHVTFSQLIPASLQHSECLPVPQWTQDEDEV